MKKNQVDVTKLTAAEQKTHYESAVKTARSAFDTALVAIRTDVDGIIPDDMESSGKVQTSLRGLRAKQKPLVTALNAMRTFEQGQLATFGVTVGDHNAVTVTLPALYPTTRVTITNKDGREIRQVPNLKLKLNRADAPYTFTATLQTEYSGKTPYTDTKTIQPDQLEPEVGLKISIKKLEDSFELTCEAASGGEIVVWIGPSELADDMKKLPMSDNGKGTYTCTYTPDSKDVEVFAIMLVKPVGTHPKAIWTTALPLTRLETGMLKKPAEDVKPAMPAPEPTPAAPAQPVSQPTAPSSTVTPSASSSATPPAQPAVPPTPTPTQAPDAASTPATPVAPAPAAQPAAAPASATFNKGTLAVTTNGNNGNGDHKEEEQKQEEQVPETAAGD